MTSGIFANVKVNYARLIKLSLHNFLRKGIRLDFGNNFPERVLNFDYFWLNKIIINCRALMHYCEEYKTVTVNACSDLLNPSVVISNSRQNHKPEESKEPKEPEDP